MLAALASYLQARARDGEWLLRIDDIDPDRSVPAAADAIQATLERFNLFWDGEIVVQSRRLERYRQALDHLRSRGWLYGCACSRKELAGTTAYPGYCRGKRLPASSVSHSLRLNTEKALIVFTDRLQGTFRHDLESETGDFVVRRRDGVFAYHLATVVDDADAEISEVLRGVDLLHSTPRQIHLQHLLNYPEPAYCHVPILVNAIGEKLSKQTFAHAVEANDPPATLCYLLRLLRQEPPDELADTSTREILDWAIRHWDVDRLARMQRIQVDG